DGSHNLRERFVRRRDLPPVLPLRRQEAQRLHANVHPTPQEIFQHLEQLPQQAHDFSKLRPEQERVRHGDRADPEAGIGGGPAGFRGSVGEVRTADRRIGSRGDGVLRQRRFQVHVLFRE
ncbi:unnamed protein product, partial [Tenebrio molitor]